MGSGVVLFFDCTRLYFSMNRRAFSNFNNSSLSAVGKVGYKALLAGPEGVGVGSSVSPSYNIRSVAD